MAIVAIATALYLKIDLLSKHKQLLEMITWDDVTTDNVVFFNSKPAQRVVEFSTTTGHAYPRHIIFTLIKI